MKIAMKTYVVASVENFRILLQSCIYVILACGCFQLTKVIGQRTQKIV